MSHVKVGYPKVFIQHLYPSMDCFLIECHSVWMSVRPTTYGYRRTTYLNDKMQCYYECAIRNYFAASFIGPRTCHCYDRSAGYFVADGNYQTTLMQQCSGNNTYEDVFDIPEYPIDLVRDGLCPNIFNSESGGDVWGKNRFGRYGPLVNGRTYGPQLHNEMSLAQVVCRQKGFTSAVGYSQGSIFSFYYDPPYITYAAFTYAECEEGDTNFAANCSYTASREHSARYLKLNRIGALCYSNETANLSTTAYFFNTKQKEGYVLALNGKNKFGLTMIEDGYVWTLNEADVVCRSAGYHSALHALKMRSSLMGWATAFRYVSCNGKEDSLVQCQHEALGSYYRGGYHYYGAAICASNQSEIDSPTLRLFGFHEPSYYHHYLSYHGEGAILMKTEASNWSLICDDHFSLAEADVACRQMGYFGAADLLKGYGYRHNNHYLVVKDDGMYHLPNRPFVRVKCNGTESKLHSCQWEEVGDQCESRTAAGISCSNLPRRQLMPTLEIINSPRNKTNEGTLRASNRLGNYGFVNDWRWTMPETEVACNQLGFTYGAVGYTWGSLFRKGQKYYPEHEAMYGTQCLGNETHIQNCSYSAKGGYTSFQKNFYYTNAGVICNGKYFEF